MPALAPVLSAATEAHEKLDPRLAALVELDASVFEPADPEAEGGGEAMSGGGVSALVQRRSGPLAFLTAPRRRTGDEAANFTRVPVFVTAIDGGALDDIALRAGGISWRSRAGDMATADVNLGQLQALEEDDAVRAVEWTGGAKPQGEPIGPCGVPPRRAIGLDGTEPATLDGTGVVVGIVDIEGIDIYHPDFLTASDAPRVVAIWDQTGSGGGGSAGRRPERYGYGVAYTRLDIWMELDPNRRVRHSHVDHVPLKVSHGTMVAGIAAGRGDGDPSARGVAPGAEIVFVNTPASGAGALAAMTEIAEAVDFVFHEAGDCPAVVNVSLGDDLGPRDGTSPVERFFDALLAERPGRAIVIAAGNSHDAGTHAGGALSGAGETARVFCDAPAPSGESAVIEIWYDAVAAEEDGIAAEVISPGGATATPRIAADGLARAFDLGSTRVVVASVKRYPGSDNALLRVEIFPREAGGAIDAGAFEIRLFGGTSPREFHAWLDHPTFRLRAGGPGGGAPAITITSPGSCRSAITVGACRETSSAPAQFTGCGPGRHDVDKPDVLACGVSLRAPSALTPNRHYPGFTGTSAAAPLVTGAVALAFQRALARGARLTAGETRALVRAAAAEGAGGVAGSPEQRGSSGPYRLLWPRDGQMDGLFTAAGISLIEPAPGAHISPEPPARGAGAKARRETEDMEQHSMKGKAEGRDMTRKQDGQQIAVGYYQLYQGTIQVGRLLVIESLPGNSAEHWDLWSTFRQPSVYNVRQEILYVYVSEPISEAEFTRDILTGSTYIIAKCQQQTNP